MANGTVDSAELEKLFNHLLGLDERKKDIADDVKSALDTFAERNQVAAKDLRKLLSAYKAYTKNPEKYTAEHREHLRLLYAMIPSLEE